MPCYSTPAGFRIRAKGLSPSKDDMTSVEIGNEPFPSDIEEYKNLKSIGFSEFPIQNLPDALIRLSELPHITKCSIFYFGKKADKYTIPDEIGTCVQLKILYISGILDIPDSLENCKNLEKIFITTSFYFYKEIPPVFYKLPKLIEFAMPSAMNEQILDPNWVNIATDNTLSCCSQSIFYTRYGNVVLNSSMRKGYIPTFMRPVYESMINGKISVQNALGNGKSKIHLYRGMNLEYVKDVKVGDIIYDNAFSSFSSSLKIASKFTSPSNNSIKIYIYK